MVVAEILTAVGLEGVIAGAIELVLVALAVKEGFDMVSNRAKE